MKRNSELNFGPLADTLKVFMTCGTVITVAYGAFKHGYHLKGNAFGVELEILP